MTLYKLTDRDDKTYNGCQWGEGVTHTAGGEGELCTKHWIHAYEHPLIAVFMNPAHKKFDPKTMHLWECEGEIGLRGGQLKCGTTILTTIVRIPVPTITTEQRVKIAIKCTLEVYQESSLVRWANAWLDGTDRFQEAAWVAAAAARKEAWAAEAAVRAAAQTWEKELPLFEIIQEVLGE